MTSNNPLNQKYILQETRELKENEFVFTHGDSIPQSAEANRMWRHICERFGITKEEISSEQLPLDSQGYRMTGFRLIRDEDV